MNKALGKDFVVVSNDSTLTAQVGDTILTYDGRADYFNAQGKNATVKVDSSLYNAEVWLNNGRQEFFTGDIKVLDASQVEGRTTLVGNDNDNTVLDLELVSGEVLFVSNSSDGEIDIYKLSVKSCDEFNVIPQEIQSEIEDEIGIVNNEITIENLTGNGMTSQFKIPLLVAFESFNQDLPIDSSTVILEDVIFDNLPEILRISIENGASKVYLSLKNAMAILNAPPMITDYLEFYKTREHILEKLNLNNE